MPTTGRSLHHTGRMQRTLSWGQPPLKQRLGLVQTADRQAERRCGAPEETIRYRSPYRGRRAGLRPLALTPGDQFDGGVVGELPLRLRNSGLDGHVSSSPSDRRARLSSSDLAPVTGRRGHLRWNRRRLQ
jgi:hypothetical protein